MAQPIGVQIGVPAGESLLLIPADHALVSGLPMCPRPQVPMLPWAQHANVNGVAFVSLHHFQAVLLYVKLNSAAWERVLAAYTKAGFLEAVAEAGATTVAEYVDVLNSLNFKDCQSWSSMRRCGRLRLLPASLARCRNQAYRVPPE
ncbi:hypothetical protein AB1Y20_018992 [Prymnesium parvum]|uniref:Uncharacterized protein n=1 Tax=Prymnesium parvum TaxID=97485 RepID=A0AB34JT26_PRYPA